MSAITTHRTASRPWPLLLLLIAGALIFAGCGRESSTLAQTSVYEGTPLEGPAPDFQLVDQDGAQVRLSDYRGEVVMLSFMDSLCEEVCPLTSLQLRSAYQRLTASEAASVVFLAVNVNLEANGIEHVAQAMEKWSLHEIAGFRFLTGSESKLAPVWEAYDITVYPAPEEGGELLHTPGVFLIDRQGQLRWYVSTPFDEEGVAQWTAPLSDLLVDHLRELLREA